MNINYIHLITRKLLRQTTQDTQTFITLKSTQEYRTVHCSQSRGNLYLKDKDPHFSYPAYQAKHMLCSIRVHSTRQCSELSPHRDNAIRIVRSLHC